jgi:hypothetical protein
MLLRFLILPLMMSLLFVLPVAAQDTPTCKPNLSSVAAALTRAQDALAKENVQAAVTAISQMRVALEQIEADCAPRASNAVGATRTNPVPFGQRQRIKLTPTSSMGIQITKLVDNANQDVKRINQRAPASGSRFVRVEFKFFCEINPNQTCNARPTDFALVGSGGVVYGYNATNNRNIAKTYELFGDGQVDMQVIFEVPQDEENLLLFNRNPRNARVFFALQ